MKLEFLNRNNEIQRIKNGIKTSNNLIVIYGRRRLGKSRLLQKIVGKSDFYHMATQSDRILQINNAAKDINFIINNFDELTYSNWDSLLNQFNLRCNKNSLLILDEFPYLVKESPELPSIIQKHIDQGNLNYNIILSGSSQRMMHGLTMDKNAPLYGRAKEILKIRPLTIGWLNKAIYPDFINCIEGFSVWGGVPRYWELAIDFDTLEEALKYLILDKNGVLHNEPERILLDDISKVTQTSAILSLIANGCHRLSEICSRLQKPATNLTRPLANLIDMGYITREHPFNENIKSTKKSLYKITEPFLLFWYRFILPNISLLELDKIDTVFKMINNNFNQHVSMIWEDLARKSVSNININNNEWSPGKRWWGKGLDGKEMEIDILAESIDKNSLIIGEAKWQDNINNLEIENKINYYINNFPLSKKYKNIIPICWLKDKSKTLKGIKIITAKDICENII